MPLPFPSFDPLPLELHVLGSERSPGCYRDAYIASLFALAVSVYARRDATFAAVARARVFAAARLLQQVPKARGGLQLYRRLHDLFGMAPAGAVAVLVVAAAAAVVVSMRLVLVVLGRLLVAVGRRNGAHTGRRRRLVVVRAQRLVAHESGMERGGRPGHVMVVVRCEAVGADQTWKSAVPRHAVSLPRPCTWRGMDPDGASERCFVINSGQETDSRMFVRCRHLQRPRVVNCVALCFYCGSCSQLQLSKGTAMACSWLKCVPS
jgi:hypothetical protein